MLLLLYQDIFFHLSNKTRGIQKDDPNTKLKSHFWEDYLSGTDTNNEEMPNCLGDESSSDDSIDKAVRIWIIQ